MWLPVGGHRFCPLAVSGIALVEICSCTFVGPRSVRNKLKSYEEVMKILEAFALTNSSRAAGELAGCCHHTVAHMSLCARPVPSPSDPSRSTRSWTRFRSLWNARTA